MLISPIAQGSLKNNCVQHVALTVTRPKHLYLAWYNPVFLYEIFSRLVPQDSNWGHHTSTRYGGHTWDTPYVSPTVLMNKIFESFAGHSHFMGDTDSWGSIITRRMRPLSSIMHVGNPACKFVDPPGRFLNLYGILYGPYNIPYKFKNRPGESTSLQGSPPAWCLKVVAFV